MRKRLALGSGACLLLLGVSCDGKARQIGEFTVRIPGQASRTTGSLAEAVAIARQARSAALVGPVVIGLPGGTTRLAKPIALTAADSGTRASPLVIRGQPDGSSILSGAAAIAEAGTAMRDVDLARTVPQMKPALAAAFSATSSPDTRLFLFEGNHRLSPTSWPAHGFASGWVKSGDAGSSRLSIAGTSLPTGSDMVATGYLTADWTHEAVAARSDGASVTLAGGPRPLRGTDMRMRLLNVPGPVAAGRFRVEQGVARVRGSGRDAIDMAVSPSIFTLDHADNIRIEKVALAKTTDTAIKIVQSNRVAIQDCFIGLTGGYAVEADGGADVQISRCVIADTGAGGVRLNAGDRATLTPGNDAVTDSLVVRFGQFIRSYTPGVALTGVGNSVARTRIGAGPHTGIVLAGNDHRIERNELGYLACETDDAGAIYMGRDWTQRGVRIVGNFIHDLAPGRKGPIVSGVYLDDQFSGAEVTNNLFLRMPHGIYIGGGRDNRIEGNVFAFMARSAVWIDDRGVSWQRAAAAEGGDLRKTLAQSPYRSELWRRRYPALAALLESRPGEPVGNVAKDNLSIGGTFLWANPIGMTIPGANNREIPLMPGQEKISSSTPLAGQYAAFRSGTFAAGVPGPAAALPYQRYVDSTLSCGISG